MAKKTRWMTWVLDESANTDIAMPWSRRRAAHTPTTQTRELAAKAPTLTFATLKSA